MIFDYGWGKLVRPEATFTFLKSAKQRKLPVAARTHTHALRHQAVVQCGYLASPKSLSGAMLSWMTDSFGLLHRVDFTSLTDSFCPGMAGRRRVRQQRVPQALNLQ